MRKLSATIAGLVVIALLAVVAPAAQALDSRVHFTADALPTWQTNGTVWALTQSGATVFAGGTFDALRPPGAADGQDTVPRRGLAVLDAATGNPTTCTLDVTLSSSTPTVRALAVSPDGRTLYVGGYFSAIKGVGRSNVAAVDIATCSVVTSFAPVVNATVRAITATADTVYVGGDFTRVAQQTRTRVAAVSTTGALRDWDPVADKPVRALDVDPNNGNVVVGGDFDTIGGRDSHALAVVTGGSGALVRAYPMGFYPRTSVVKGISSDSTGFYVSNEGTGGGVFDGRTALDWGTYDQRWRDTCLGATQAAIPYDGVLYSVSHAHDCSSIDAFPDGRRQHLLAQPTQGSKPVLLPWYPDTNDGIGEGIGPRAITIASGSTQDYLWIGGEFTSVNGTAQRGLSRFGQTPDTGNPLTPVGVSAVSQLAGKVQVRWEASTDQDDGLLTYLVYRDGGSTPIGTVTGDSSWWSKPQVGYTDDTAAPGTTHSYRVRAVDAAGNQSGLSASVSATVASTSEAYARTVLADSPTQYWRLDGSTGLQHDSSDRGEDLARANAAASVGLLQSGALAGSDNPSIGFLGTSASFLYSTPIRPGPTTFSVEAWINTTTNRGGKIIGFGNRQRTASTDYDRQIYMTDAGRLAFGIYAGATWAVTSPNTYNDGKWHHVVGTVGPAGTRLYVDGTAVASNTASTPQSFSGVWRIGGDSTGGWPGAPSSNYFSGRIDEVAVYGSALSAERVAAHHTAGADPETAPVDTQAPSTPGSPTNTVSGTDVNLSWQASTDDTGVTGYQIHRSTQAGFTPTTATRIATTTGTTYTDGDRPAGTWYYRVIAVDAAGNTSTPSTTTTATVANTGTPTVVTLTPTEDTYTNQSAANSTYGTATTTAVRGTPGYQSYLKFDWPETPAGQQLTGATLTIRTSSADYAGSTDTFPVRLATSDWTETGLTWNTRPDLGAQVGQITGATQISTAYTTTLDATALRTGAGNPKTLVVTGTGTDNLWFSTRTAAANARPTLQLTYTTP